MICSSAFICTGLASMQISGHSGAFAKFIMIALIFSWFGDLFLHIDDSAKFFIIGAFSFLVGHIFYITAYHHAQNSLLGSSPLFSKSEIITVAVFLLIVALILFGALKLRPGMLTAPISIYAVVLSAMFIKAVFLGIGILRVDPAIKNGTAVAVLLICGAALFVISDATLAVITCDEKRNTFKLKVVNIATYFAAQVLLASTILCIE
ncbi:MAG: lysoplasmalogenase [Clostridiales bacterium]|nr:lysoplasmalogenase [Clostridiales bacterium]